MAKIYTYPVSENLTEPVEAAQDPGKRQRECEVIADAAGFRWAAALDFGCGRGANLALLASGASMGARLWAVDPDGARLREARALAETLSGPRVDLEVGGIDQVEHWPEDRTFDLILVCQVIGHVPVSEAERILRSLRARLSPRGRLVLLYPFSTPLAARSAAAPAKSDFLHLVDASRAPTSAGFRTPLSRQEFDAAARAPARGLLPVRCFHIATPSWRPGSGLPSTAETPASIASVLPDMNVRTAVYSVHSGGEDGAAIGDLVSIAEFVGEGAGG